MASAPQTIKNESSRRALFPRGTFVFCVALILAACATVGRDFDASKVYDIQMGKTTQAEILHMFGRPWRVGVEDGKPRWTYGSYHYSAFGETRTKDLVVRFDANNVVTSYTFNTTDAAEIKKPRAPGR